MAYFERGDELNMLITCNICNVKVKERGLLTHRNKCAKSPNHNHKFKNGTLQYCPHDSNHILEAGRLEAHLEFCKVYQGNLVKEFQLALADDELHKPKPGIVFDPKKGGTKDDHWVREVANSEDSVATQMGKLKL